MLDDLSEKRKVKEPARKGSAGAYRRRPSRACSPRRSRAAASSQGSPPPSPSWPHERCNTAVTQREQRSSASKGVHSVLLWKKTASSWESNAGLVLCSPLGIDVGVEVHRELTQRLVAELDNVRRRGREECAVVRDEHRDGVRALQPAELLLQPAHRLNTQHALSSFSNENNK